MRVKICGKKKDNVINLEGFFFGHVYTREMNGIRTSDFRFINRDPSQLNYFLRKFERFSCTCFATIQLVFEIQCQISL
jgi:hypothetical protein